MSKIGQEKIRIDEELSDAANEINGKIRNHNRAKATETKEVEKAELASNQELEWDMFRDYVNTCHLAIKKKDGGLYLKAEAWLYLAMLKGVVPSLTVETRTNTNQDLEVIVYCKLLDKNTHEVVSQSAMSACEDEPFLIDKPRYAVLGMAQTRAISRAVRNVYGYIVRGAGFESTPAIEMGLEEDVAD